MHVAKSTRRLVSIFLLPAPLRRTPRLPSRVGGEPTVQLPAGLMVCVLGDKLWHMPLSWASSSRAANTGANATSQKVRTQKNLLSVRVAFRRAGSAAESTFNLLSNYIMEQGTNYCLFPALLETSFTGFILPLNHFSSSTVFQLLKSHFWKCLHPNDNSNKIYYMQTFICP